MDLTDILEGSRTNDQNDISQLLKFVFRYNWKENFIFDGINDKVISYKDFFNMVLNCKEQLESIGIKRNDIICLWMSNSIDLLTLYFASLIMQTTAVPIDINKGERDIKEILSQLKYRTILSNIHSMELTGEDIINTSEFSQALYKKRRIEVNELDIFDDIDYNRLFLITFTSGSTGAAKGVMHSFNNLALSALAFKKRFGFGKKNIFYHNLPMTYMAGILNLIILPFISESKIVLGERFNISNTMRFWDTPIRYSANTFWFIPAIISLLLKIDRGTQGIDYASKNRIIGCVGTAPLNNMAKIAFQKKYNIPLYESYGLSETLFVTTNSPRELKTENSVGEKLDGVELDFCDDGEISIDVPWMFLGYTNIETSSYFKDEKYLSGDIGTIDKNGFVYITGRKKDLIIRGGVNISPKKIEDFVGEHDVFEENVVMGFEDVNLGEKIVCFYVPRENVNIESGKKKLNSGIIKKLGKDYHIDEFVQMKEIPRTDSGKIDKPRIRSMQK